MDNVAGTYIDTSFISNLSRPPDELLDWHFHQAVLTNMKGMGEPCFENDFPPGSDMVFQIIRGSKAPERIEFELFTRLDTLQGVTRSRERLKWTQWDFEAGSGEILELGASLLSSISNSRDSTHSHVYFVKCI